MSGHEALVLGARIRRGLADLRRRARLSLLVRGGASLALAVVSLSLISFGLDRTLRLSWETRATLLVLALCALLVVVVRRLMRPLGAALSDVELARQVEATHPELDWRLLSAVQFADPRWTPGPETSLALAACVVRDAEALAARVSFGAPVPVGPAARAAARGAVVLAAGLSLVLAFPGVARTWLLRNVLLSAAVEWPRDTHLTLEAVRAAGVVVPPGPRGFTVPRGVDLTIVVSARGVIPSRVHLHTQASDPAQRGEELTLDALEGGSFRATLPQVAHSFTFEVEGGDDALGPFVVEVLQRPWIERLELEVEPPGYTALPARRFPLESSSLSLPRGTQVRLLGQVSKPLLRMQLEEVAVGAPPHAVARIHTGTVTATPPAFSVGFSLDEPGVFGVELLDQDRLTLERPTRFTAVAVADRVPDVRLRLSGVGLNVTPAARIDYTVEARDDYGLTAGQLRWRARLGEEPPLEGGAPLEALVTDGAAAGTLQLEALGLQPKMALVLWAEASDNDPQGPNQGASAALQLRVVTPEELLNELLRRLHEQRLELERLIAQEDQLAQGLAALDPTTMERAPLAQRDVARGVVRGAETVEGVAQEMTSNRLLDETTWARLEQQIAAPLRNLAAVGLREAAELAEAAREAQEAARAPTAMMASEAAHAAARELRLIVDRMGRLEELAELVSALKRVIRDQRGLMEDD